MTVRRGRPSKLRTGALSTRPKQDPFVLVRAAQAKDRENNRIFILREIPLGQLWVRRTTRLPEMNNHHSHDIYYDNPSARSPGSHRQQHQHQQQQQQPPLHRASSRQFDAYGQMPSGGLYTAEDHAARYETNRFDRLNGGLHGNYNAYEMSTAQTWNPASFGVSSGMTALGATGRMKPSSRPRAALPSVSRVLPHREFLPFGTDPNCRLGWTNKLLYPR